MSETLKNPESRKEFHTWLFKLADVNERKAISQDELELLLKALEFDGIHPDSLSVSGTTTASQTTAESTKKLLEEYDTGKTGLLTQEQFMALADVIAKNYELRSADMVC
jgi:Ca2+-binding EF-hand superfamily protein